MVVGGGFGWMFCTPTLAEISSFDLKNKSSL